ncbi:MAG: hypothetical protein HYZ33_04295 [Ignavibacteriales bacterium]|nr:hypothetical protein [Ignavibacteriales bacterium]
MSTMLDIIGSMLIGGIVMVMVLNVNSNYVTLQGKQTLSRVVQSNATTAAEVLENDFRKIGYRCTDTMKIKYIDTSKLIVLGDFDDNGVVDSLKYYLDYSTPVYPSPNNTNIRMLYRVFNTQSPSPINLGFSRFRLWYFDSLENETSVRSNIRSIKVAFQFESPYKYETTTQYDTGYYSLYWERIVKPKNLK